MIPALGVSTALDTAKNLLFGGGDPLASYHQDNLFIGTRDKTFDALRSNGFPESEWGAYTKNVAHSEVPDRLFGPSYQAVYGKYYSMLFDDVRAYLNFKKPGMGEFFASENQRIAMELPAGERFKGSPWNAVNSAAGKFKNTNSGMFETNNLLDGLGVSQAYVENGNIKVPEAQQGEGVFGSLTNYAAAVLTPTIANSGINGGQILSQAAAGISGQQQLASSGQVVLTGGVSVGGSVTKNTTSGGSSTSSGSILMYVIGGIVLLFVLGGGALFKKFFK